MVVNRVFQLPHITPSSVFNIICPFILVPLLLSRASDEDVRLFGAQVKALARAARAATSSTSGSRGVIVPLLRIEDVGETYEK